jgi:hypothetical protein
MPSGVPYLKTFIPVELLHVKSESKYVGLVKALKIL